MHHYALVDLARRKIIETVGPVASFARTGSLENGCTWTQVTDDDAPQPAGTPEFAIGPNAGVIRYTNIAAE